MKNKIKKGFLALALIFSLIGITTLKNKVGAYGVENLITEFNTENLLSEFVVDSIHTDDTFTTTIVLSEYNDFVEGFTVDLFYSYLLNLNGFEKYISDIAIFPVENGQLYIDSMFILPVDTSSSQQIISIFELTNSSEIILEPNIAVVQFAFMIFTPEELGPITKDMLQGIGLYNYQSELLYKPGGISENGLNGIFDLINNPINDLFNYIGIDESLIFTPGFGQITWFEISLRQFIKLVIVFVIGLWFIKFLARLIKKFFGLILGVFNI